MGKEIKVTKSQFERLMESVQNDKSQLHERKKKEVDENLYSQSNPGQGAGEGLAVVVNSIKKAWGKMTDPELRKKAKEFLQMLSKAAGEATSSMHEDDDKNKKIKEKQPKGKVPQKPAKKK